MTIEQAAPSDREDRLAAALAACLEAIDSGPSVNRATLLARYPEFASELARFLDDQEQVECHAAPLRAAAAVLPPGEPGEHISVPKELGDFRILREVGRGGMGVVYEAEQLSLRRRVALKVLPFAATMDPRHLQRFHNEAQAAACLHHTNIVPVFFVGSERGVHFYAMQFIDGQPLSDLIRQLSGREKLVPAAAAETRTVVYQPAPGDAASTPAPAAEMTPLTGEGRRGRDYFRKVAELGVQAAEALDHAHQLGIVHRDIKPANLLLDGRGNLWVTDFGLAHIQHGEGNLTVTGQALGTPRYMSPEQALAQRVPIDHRTDVYSLGVTLYELLTLRPAFVSVDRQELMRQIAFEEPAKPRRWERAIPAELEIIVLKALEKRPQDRYATAQELADDLRRWLDERPIQAQPPSWAQVMRKWARRHRGLIRSAVAMLILAVICLSISIGIVMSAYREEEQARKDADYQRDIARDSQNEEKQQRRIAEGERDRSRYRLYLRDVRLAQHALETSNLDRAEELLENHRPKDGSQDLRGWEWYYLIARCHRDWLTLKAESRQGAAMVWSPDGRRLATAETATSSVKIWTPAEGLNPLVLQEHKGQVFGITWSPDSRQLASAGDKDGTILIWDASTGQIKRRLGEQGRSILTLAWTKDGRRLASGESGGRIKVWDLATGQDDLSFMIQPLGPTAVVLDWSPDGALLAGALNVGGRPKKGDDPANFKIKVWDAKTGTEVLNLDSEPGLVGSVRWSPDGQRLASVGLEGGPVKIWDRKTGKNLLTLPGHLGVSWSPDGQFVAAPGSAQKNAILVWDATTGKQVDILQGHRSKVTTVTWNPQGNWLAASDDQYAIKIWDLNRGQDGIVLGKHESNISALAWTRQGDRLASGSSDGTIRLWEPSKKKTFVELREKDGRVSSLAWRPDDKQLVTTGMEASRTPCTQVWDAKTGKEIVRLRGRFIDHGVLSITMAATWHPDGKWLASIGRDTTIKIWDASTWKEVRSLEAYGNQLAWSPDGHYLAVGGKVGPILLWDTITWKECHPLRGHAAWPLERRDCVTALCWRFDGRYLASGSADGTVKV